MVSKNNLTIDATYQTTKTKQNFLKDVDSLRTRDLKSGTGLVFARSPPRADSANF
jgi:hypothetical protein